MRDSRHGGPSDRSGEGLSALARTVVASLTSRDASALRRPDAALVHAMARALGSGDPAAFDALRPELRRARIGEIELVDSYFPAVARLLGCDWVEDRAPFTEVSLGVARMQAILRQVGRDWGSNALAGPDSATVLMILPEGEQHTFGAMVLTGQLRRQGISVQLQIGAQPRALADLVSERGFDCAMISVGCEERLETCRKLVKTLKEGSGARLPVAVGGAVLDRPVDVRRATAADIVTNDPMVALQGARDRQPVPEREVG
jgi:MerR family transcriptional regulator, light-induced transcriptional regulator